MKKQRYDAVICGYYGMGNTGDDAMLSSIINMLKSRIPDIRLAVISTENKTVNGVKYVKRCSPSCIKAIACADTFIFGGGNLIQNVTSRRSLLYYFSLLISAKLFSLRTVIFSNGIGPVRGGAKSRITKLFFRLSDMISLRDADSYGFALNVGAAHEKTFLFADPVFMNPVFPVRKAPFLGSYYAVSLRKCSGGAATDLSKIYEFAKKHGDKTPVFISMHDEYDLDICKCAAEMTHGVALPSMDFDDLVSFLSGASFSFGMRLHFLIASVMAGVPTVALSYDTKTDGVMNYIGDVPVLSSFDFTASELSEAVAFVTGDKDIKNKLLYSSERMRLLSEYGADTLCDFLKYGNTADNAKEIKA